MSSFPYKLHQLLTDIEDNEELSSIISWLPSGDGFRIHKPEVFASVLLKKYFPRQSKLKSFKRQVQYYGFDNLARGSYSHPSFVRGKRSLCGKIIHKLPMKNIKTTPKSATAKQLLLSKAEAVRSTSPSSLSPIMTATSPVIRRVSYDALSMSCMPSNKLVMHMYPQAPAVMSSAMSPAKIHDASLIHPMFTQSSSAIAQDTTQMKYLNQLKQNNDHLNAARHFQQQQAMQQYLRLLFTR